MGESPTPRVCAVVVTHNRHDLLIECLDRLDRQSRPPDHVLVVDNASTDQTLAMLGRRDGIEVLSLEENVGGAGGFAAGIQRTHAAGYDWLWLMDDDTFCDENCLESLLAGAGRAPREPSLVCSVVRWKDGTLHPMNNPALRRDRREEFVDAAGAGLALVRTSSLVSTMIRREAVDEHGLPPAHFFIWSDDLEYTGRILREGAGYMVPESLAWHWTPEPHDIITDPHGRFYYRVRNELWLLRGPGFQGMERVSFALGYLRILAIYVKRNRNNPEALRTVVRGIRDGLRKPPL